MDVDTNSFADLQQQAEQLSAEMDNGTDLPRVDRNLAQILEAGHRLLSKVAPISQDNTDVKASILLGSRGYDVPKISQRLEGLNTAKSFESLEPVRDTDIQGFLRNERENALLAAIQQTRRNIFEEAQKGHWESKDDEFEREKQRILNTLLGAEQDSVDFQSGTDSFLSDPVSLSGRSNLDYLEMAYSRQVYAYNEQVIESSIRPDLVQMFQNVAASFNDKSVSDLWDMVQCMVDVRPVSSGQSTRLSPQTQKDFVRNAKRYLEQTYVKFITAQISGNLQQAQLGGVPGTYNLVRSYLNIHQSTLPRGLEDGTVDGHPVWAMIYYCLRCGDLNAALTVVSKAGHPLGEEFSRFLKEYMSNTDHRLSPGSLTNINLQYRRTVKQCPDPFKKAVYCVIGQCDYTDDHTDVADKIDDYLWIKMCQVKMEPAANDQDQFTLQKLQTLLYEEYGESHFNGYQQPFLYFQVLVLTAQFEVAIEFMSRIQNLRCHGVHVAMVLYSNGLLLLPKSTQAQLLTKDQSDPSPLRRLNFGRLIMTYTRKFEETDPREALQYFYWLRNLETHKKEKAPSSENMFMMCVSELVRETKEYEMLLGKLLPDGTRKPGAIDKFKVDTQQIIEMVARDTEANGAFEDAVRLYDLAKKQDKVLELLNKLLSQVVSQVAGPQSNKDRLKNLAVSVAGRYRTQGAVDSNRSNTSSFYLILDLVTFFDLYHEGRMEEALEVIRQLQLLPLSTEAVEHKVNSFRNYTDEVRRCLPDVLLATMNVLHHQYKNARNTALQSSTPRTGRREDGGKETFLNYIRDQAKALITFAGMLPYRLPGDTYARLVQVEVLLN